MMRRRWDCRHRVEEGPPAFGCLCFFFLAAASARLRAVARAVGTKMLGDSNMGLLG
jgi:hypothetical protein